MARRATIAVWALAATACAPFATPHASGARKQSSVSPLAQAQAAHEYPTPPAPESAAGGAPDPARAVIAFTRAYINWTAATVSGDMSSLAARSVGQARSVVTLAAAQTVNDYELKRGGIGNSGQVEAVAPLQGKADEFVVVTRELTTATNSNAYQGLGPAWHVALATVTQLRAGHWVVSVWQPES